MSNMKKSGKIYRIGALLVVVCLISTVMLSGTFAKYTDSYAGQDTALVARWSFGATDGTTSLGAPDDDSIKELDLFSHAYDVNINQTDGADYIIAPGVNDDFTIEMKFLSDVDAKVTVNFTKEGTVGGDLPIEYSVDEGSTWVDLDGLEDAFVAAVVNDSATAADTPDNTFTFKRSAVDDTGETTITQVVKWRWAFDDDDQAESTPAITSDDETDTGFGNDSAEGADHRTTYILNVSVLAEQIAPTTTP